MDNNLETRSILIEIVKHQMGKHNQMDHAKGLKQAAGNAKRAVNNWVKKHPKIVRAGVLGAAAGVAAIGTIADMHAAEAGRRLGQAASKQWDELQTRNEELAAKMNR